MVHACPAYGCGVNSKEAIARTRRSYGLVGTVRRHDRDRVEVHPTFIARYIAKHPLWKHDVVDGHQYFPIGGQRIHAFALCEFRRHLQWVPDVICVSGIEPPDSGSGSCQTTYHDATVEYANVGCEDGRVDSRNLADTGALESERGDLPPE